MAEVISRQEARALGLTRYFTGKPCSKGHAAERAVSGKTCCACRAESRRVTERVGREKDPEKYRSRERKSYRKNREKILECQKEYREKNPGRELKRRYGITNEDYERMYQRQAGKCAICFDPHQRLCIDHCHSSGTVRGLLCQRCNKGIGLMRDNTEFLANAIKYLLRGGR